jgi:hypothetical protein
MTPLSKRLLRLSSVFALALLVYLLTRAPGLTWQHRGADGGDFLAAAATMGVAHPAGYPTYTILLRLFMSLPAISPAAAGNLLSALMGAVAAAFCFALIRELLEQLVRGEQEQRLAEWSAAVGALAFGFNPLVWSQALITEVYAFHLALVAAAFWLLLRWRRTGRGLALFGLVVGLGMTNHLTTAFLAPAALPILVAGRTNLIQPSRPRTSTGQEDGSPSGVSTGKQAVRQFGAALLQVMAAGGAFCVGLAPYAYLPWAARRLPPVNWENPQSWEGFKRLVLATRYSHNLLEASPAEVWSRVTGWIASLPLPIFWPVYVLLLVGLLWLLLRDPSAGVMTGTYAVLAAGYAAGYGTTDYWVNLLPAIMMVTVWLAVGIWLVLRWVSRRRWRYMPLARAAVMLLTLALPAGLLVSQWNAMDVHEDRVAEDWVALALEIAEPNALIFTRSDQFTFGMWYGCYVLDARADLTPILPTFLQREWYRDTLAANHPGLDLDPAGLRRDALLTMISRHLDQRPIYLTWEDETTAENYDLVKEYPLWRVTRRAGSGPTP